MCSSFGKLSFGHNFNDNNLLTLVFDASLNFTNNRRLVAAMKLVLADILT